MRAVTDQREPVVDDPGGVLEAERPGRPRAVEREIAEQVAHPLHHFGKKRAVRQLQHARGVLLVHRPHQRAAMLAIGAVEHRQKREGPVGIEDFPRHILMRLGVVEPGDHRAVAVIPLRHLEARLLARRRPASFGADHQRGFERAPVTQRGRHAEFAAFARGHFGRGMPGNQRFLRRGFVQREAQLAIGEHAPQRAFMRLGPEVEPSRLHLVEHADRGNIAAMRFEHAFKPDMAEQSPTGGRDRRGAPVEALGSQAGGIGAVDEVARQPLPRRRQRQGHPHQAAAQDQQVSLVCHGG